MLPPVISAGAALEVGRAVAVSLTIPEVAVRVSPAVGAGASQSQWSPCGSQPMEAVGLGPGSAEPVTGAFSSWVVSAAAAVELAAVASTRGPSQSLEVVVSCGSCLW